MILPDQKKLGSEIQRVLRDHNALYGATEWSGERTFTISERDSAGDDEPPTYLREAASRAVAALKKVFPQAEVRYEIVDEWMDVSITFPIVYEITEEGFTSLVDAAKAELERIGHPVKKQTNNPWNQVGNQAGPQITTLETKTPQELNCYYIPNEITIKATCRPTEEHIEIILQGHGRLLFPNVEAAKAALPKILGNLTPKPPTGWPVQEIEEPTKKSDWKVLGCSGYDGPWYNCPFYQTPEGKIIHKREDKTWWECTTLKAGITALAEEFYPKVPEGARPLKEIARERGKLLEDEILTAGEQGTDQLAQYGIHGKTIATENGIYILPSQVA